MKRVIDILGRTAVIWWLRWHTIMNEVPAENILAMVDATLEFGTYLQCTPFVGHNLGRNQRTEF